MDFKSRSLRSAFILPLAASMAWAPLAYGFELTGDDSDEEYTATVQINSGSTPDDGESIIIDGTPGTGDAALIINDDRDIVLDGQIRIRDRTSDTASEGASALLGDAYGVHITANLTGDRLRLKDGARIQIVEIRGPGYDGDDDDSLPDANDSDEDGIIEGSPALAGDNNRIGLWVDTTISASSSGYSLVGERGSSIIVYGNAASVGDVAGVKIDNRLDGHLDLWTGINVFGDNARGVDVNNEIGGNYRHRGNIDVRGENTVGIDIGNTITGSLMIEGNVNATGYSAYPGNSVGAPRRGGGDFEDDDDDEFSAQQIAANPNERRNARATVEIGAAVDGGVIIGGTINRAQTRDELLDFTCKEEDEGCDADGISEKRSNGLDVSGDKTAPFHYDENRGTARLTSHGESLATLYINATLAASGATVETFLDTADDDDDDTSDSTTDVADFYDSTQEFYFSHGLMNRGSISANSLYDSVNNGSGYQIDLPATAILLNNAGVTIHGGIFNSGTISATAFNADATALNLNAGVLTDGQRDDDVVVLNEGNITASTSSHTRSYSGVTAADNTATAVKIGGVTYTINGATPAFVNAGSVSASSRHTQLNTDTEDDDDYETILGDNATAFDLTGVGGNFNLTQRMRQADELVGGETDSDGNVDHSQNGSSNPYRGSGDTDIDRAGDTQTVGDNTVTVGDGKIDTRDTGSEPSITGDVKFGGDDNVFTVLAGRVTGDIDFGAGADSFVLGNSMEDDANSEDDDPNDDIDDEVNDYEAPITRFQGVIENTGNLSITLGGQDSNIASEKTRLHFDGQEGRDTDGDGTQDEENEGLSITTLTLDEKADLRFTVNPDFLANEILDVATLTINSDDVTISPFITTLITANTESLKLVDYGTLNGSSSIDINDRLPEDGHPYIYNVTLRDDTATSAIFADFSLKTAAQLGLNRNEAAAYDAVIAHFRRNENLEEAITGIADADAFGAFYGQLLPHHGDGTMRQLSGLADMATGAVGQHLQIVNAGGRRGGDGWAQQFGDYRKQDGSTQTDRVSGTSYGLATGYDAPAGLIDALGVYGQMSFTSVHEKPVLLPGRVTPSTDEVRAESFAIGAYLSDRIGPVSLEVNAAYGSVTFDSVRGVNFNGISDVVRGSWDGTSTAASARLTYPILDFGHLLRAEAGIDHFALEQDGYRERTGNTSLDLGLAMQVGRAESDMTSHFIGLRGGYRSGGGTPAEIVWEPNYYIGYRSVADTTAYAADANFIGSSSDTFRLTALDEPGDSVDFGLGVAAHNDYFAFEFTYRGKIGDDEEMHGGGISIRLLF